MIPVKLQPASKKEVKRIAAGSAVCYLIMVAGLFLLAQFGIGKFNYTVFLGGAIGTVVAVLNFLILCLTIQKVAGMENGKPLKARVQFSYNIRLALQAVWVIVAFIVPVFHTLASAIPLLFPTVVLYYLKLTGKLVTPSERKNSDVPEEEEQEPRLDSFEV